MVCSSGDFESWDDVLPMPHQMTALHVSMGSARRFRSASHGHWSDATNATLMSMKVGREGLPANLHHAAGAKKTGVCSALGDAGYAPLL